MRVGLIMFHGSPRAPTSVCDHIKLQTFFDGAGFALCCGPRSVGRDMPVGLLLVMRAKGAADPEPAVFDEPNMTIRTESRNRALRWPYAVVACLLTASSVSAQQRFGPRDVDALPSSAPTLVERYCDDALTFGELRIPSGTGPFPGRRSGSGGCWTVGFATSEHGTTCLGTDRGWRCNVEYRISTSGRSRFWGGQAPSLTSAPASINCEHSRQNTRSISPASRWLDTPPAPIWRCGVPAVGASRGKPSPRSAFPSRGCSCRDRRTGRRDWPSGPRRPDLAASQ